MISLEKQLSKFKPHENFEYEGSQHLTHVPSLGKYAYLNILHDAIDGEVQTRIIDRLRLPFELREFYRSYNGAHLFSDNMSIYGFFPAEYLYERQNWRKSYPYNIENINAEFMSDWISSDIIVIGSYGLDRSEVFVEKSTGLVHCSVGKNLNRLRASWPSFQAWVEQEIARLSECFDENGIMLVEQEETLPQR